jgi:antagonist of KipI
MGSLHVVRPGLLTTVQDLGRWGFQSLGVPVAGAMDPFSHRLANILVGNPASAATLEVTMSGPELGFSDERGVATAGAEYHLTVDGRAVPHGELFRVGRGAVLRFGDRLNGARAYLAVTGGIDVPQVLRSRSTHLPSRMGGLAGRRLVTGDHVPLGDLGGSTPRRPASASSVWSKAGGAHKVVVESLRTSLLRTERRVRVVAGPQEERFAREALDVLQSAAYRVQPDSDRMGFRLAGMALRHLQDANMISDATPLGALQVPASGQPILLMADRQTTGGYPKIATVITADIAVVAQAAPGDSICFAVCTQGEAVAALIAQERALMAFEAHPS